MSQANFRGLGKGIGPACLNKLWRKLFRAPCLEIRFARFFHIQFKAFSVCEALTQSGAVLQAWGMISKQTERQTNEVSSG